MSEMKLHRNVFWQEKGVALVMHGKFAAERIYGCYCRMSNFQFGLWKRKDVPALALVHTAISGHNCPLFMIPDECPKY